MITLGFDPDLHSSGAAIVRDNQLLMVALTNVSAREKGPRAASRNIRAAQALAWPIDAVERIAIEIPQVYSGSKNKVDPADLINLTLVSGGASDALWTAYPAASQAFLTPQAWKGQVPKHIHHGRICEALGIQYTTNNKRVLPVWASSTLVLGNITAARAQHVLDACGLALFAQKLGIIRHLICPTTRL